MTAEKSERVYSGGRRRRGGKISNTDPEKGIKMRNENKTYIGIYVLRSSAAKIFCNHYKVKGEEAGGSERNTMKYGKTKRSGTEVNEKAIPIRLSFRSTFRKIFRGTSQSGIRST